MESNLTSIVLSKYDNFYDIFAKNYVRNMTAPLLVVDDGLSPETRERWNQFKYIESPKPFSFCLSVNAAIRELPGRDILLFNDDCIIHTKDTDKFLEETINVDLAIGIATPIMDNVQNTDQWPDKQEPHVEHSITKNSISFTCVCIPIRAIEEVGLLDEGFAVGIAGAEDRDYCLRLKEAGYLFAIDHRCFVQHGGPEFGRSISNTRFAEGQLELEVKNDEYFREKYGAGT